MSIGVKQIIKPYYKAVEKTCLYAYFNMFLNLFLRHNNLLLALIKAKVMGNEIVLGRNIKLRHCVFTIHGSGNHITIQDNCRLSGLRVFTNSSNNTLLVGKNTIVNAGKNSFTLFNACDGGGYFYW